MSLISVTMKATELGKDLESISIAVRKQLEEAIKSVSRMAYNQGTDYIQQGLNTTRQQYLLGYHYSDLGNNTYLIYLDNEVNFLEDGYASFDQKPGILRGPKSKATKDGTGRYNTIPFAHRPHTQAPMTKAEQEIQRNLVDVIKRYKLGKIIRDTEGRPKEGVVARVTGKDLAANLQGLVKIQKVYEKKTESYYMTFRRVSSKSAPGSWIHPGWRGLHAFPKIEDWTNRQIESVLNTILS